MNNANVNAGAEFGAHALDHAIGLSDSLDLVMSESNVKVEAGPYSTIACFFSAGGCNGTLSTLNPF